MTKEEFRSLFGEVTSYIASLEYYLYEEKSEYTWFDLLIPDNTLVAMVNSNLVRGVWYYLKAEGSVLEVWGGPPEANDWFEEISLCETYNHYWFLAFNADVSECVLGKLRKEDVTQSEEELFDGFVNYCLK